MGYVQRSVDVTSSLPLQILIYYNWVSIFIYFVITVSTFIYKGTEFSYPTYLIGWEASAFSLLLIIDLIRLFFGTKGNKSRSIKGMALFLFLSLVVIIGNVYFIEWQTFVLRVDIIVHSISLAFIVMEVSLSIFCLISFAGSSY